MAEYLKIVNDSGFVMIDDSFQNYHFLEKRQIDTKTLPHYSTGYGGTTLEDSNGFTLCEYVFNVTSIKKPVVAYRSGILPAEDDDIMAITFTETTPNNWKIKVMFDNYFSSGTGVYKKPVIYIFGLLPPNATPSTGTVFQVKNSAGELIFDSGRKPMTVVDFKSFITPAKWGNGSDFTPKKFPIPNWDANRVYAIIPCTFMFNVVYRNPNFYYYYSTYSYINRNDGTVYVYPTQCGINNIMWAQDYPSMTSYFHSYILIDVTGY
ncbi:hypothetical protein BJD49_gp153 [Acinetobacter phage vB_AbaM_phiAbaA1]|uniref:hypothetical protein n=1 Tax=Acinetobacter phage vB_AbaM_phiAbaA1 TaxID=1605379 RepID=UPI00078D7A0F|nr:hypothetical protein BJD49_gp153 [Acinetobacter phage vB_AbaM_phiAbaA1]AJK27137.1 hypothetical protein phiAbaA1_034 [Acinetobacter phage vB_AbaM_phiAbaA1]